MSLAAIPKPAQALVVSLALALGIAALYAPTLDHGFLDYDDRTYVHGNARVAQGLTVGGVRWAMKTGHAANWHPLTWLSHQADVELYGLDPRGHHATSVALHALASVLLFLALRRATGSTRRSAVVAALFAAHPVAVDSVAWVAERKNVLSTVFGFAALLAYVRYCERPSMGRYVLVAGLFGAGLMAKPMLVTLPLVFLLLDLWPLGRLTSSAQRIDGGLVARRVAEKLPLLAISVAASAMTVWAQQRGGAVEALDAFPFGVRAAHALAAYAGYLRTLAWPSDLAILHPHPADALRAARVAGAAALLITLGAAVAWAGRSRRYLWVGALWFVGTLVPVIGLVQVGAQGVAERYLYLPMVGVLVAVVWLAADLTARARLPAAGSATAAALAIVLCAWATRAELVHWRNEVALFTRAVELHEASGVETKHAMILYYQLGHALGREGRSTAAIERYEQAIQLNPDYAPAHNNLGSTLSRLGRDDEAAAHFEAALEVAPEHPSSLFNLGMYRLAAGDVASGRSLLARFIDTGAAGPRELERAAAALLAAGAAEEAGRAAARMVRVAPNDAGAHALAAAAALARGHDRAARQSWLFALAIDPDSRTLRNNLAHLLATSSDPAVRDPARALEMMETLARESVLDASERDTYERAQQAATR